MRADQGATIKVKVSFSDDANNAETLTSVATAAVAAAPNTAATGVPGITGTAQVGQTLTAVTSAIMDADGLSNVSYTYQWIRVATDSTETDISGATASGYTLVRADQGATIKVKVSFSDDANNAETLTSVATAAVAAASNTAATGVPGITGTAQVGQTLTAVTSAIMDADGLSNVSYTYQWIRVDGGSETDISGATSSGLHPGEGGPGQDHQGQGELQTTSANNAETLTSVATAAVAAAPNDRRDGRPPGITGTAHGRADADGGHQRHHGRRRADRPHLRLPVDPGGHRQHRDGHLLGDVEHLHPGGGRPGQDHQGQGELQRRRRQRRDAHQRGDGGGGGGGNAAPTASDRTVTTHEDTDYTFAAANFNFADTDSGAALSSVKIVTLPAPGKGTLKLDGSAIALADLPQTVTTPDIDAGKLTYTPPANANGSGYASFTFKVNDGTDDSASAYTLTIDVTALNAAPTASDRTVTTHEDTDYTFAAANFNFTDTDSGAALSSVKIVTLPAPGKGTLKLSGTVTANATVTKAQHGRREPQVHPAGERQRIGLREFYLQGQRRHRRQRLRLHADLIDVTAVYDRQPETDISGAT